MTTEVLDTQARELDLETGIDRSDREKLAAHLNRALASTYVLYNKTHLFHWNVAGPLFYSVHKLTDEQYRDLAAAVDDLAERVRSIGFPATGGLKKMLEQSVVDDADQLSPPTRDMVALLAKDHQRIALDLRKAVKEAEKWDDVYTADLLTSRIGVHEEAAWMLQATLAD